MERFRFTIVTSQLLNAQLNLSRCTPFEVTPTAISEPSSTIFAPKASSSLIGVVVTALTAYVLVWLISWAAEADHLRVRIGRALLVLCFAVICLVLLYTRWRRQSLLDLRQRALAAATALVARSQEYDAAAASALVAIQDVELVARGYRL